MPKFESETLGVCYDFRDDLRQRDVEAYFRAEREIRAGLHKVGGDEHASALISFTTELLKAKPKMEREKFSAAVSLFQRGLLIQDERMGVLGEVETCGVYVRAAVRCEWLSQEEAKIEENDVGDMHPGVVLFLSGEIQKEIAMSYEVSPE